LDIAKLPSQILDSIESRLETRRWQAHETKKGKHLNNCKGPPAGPIFIFGCQRSGTTHVERLFRADPRSRVFGEFSALSITPKHTVWQPPSAMREILAAQPGEYWVIRSLLASHRIIIALDAWPSAAALWIFRDANSVVDSMIRKWGGNFRAISERVETDLSGKWDLRDLWDNIEDEAEKIAPRASQAKKQRDIYGLFWYYRNRLILDLELPQHPRVSLASYADFTVSSDKRIAHLLKEVGLVPPQWRYPLSTRKAPIRDNSKPRLSNPLQEKCDALYDALLQTSNAGRQSVISS
jgi:hypothetical protein